MNLAGYIRVSTEGQVDAYGKDVQRKYISDWAEMNAHTVVAWFEEDGVSGKTESAERPALRELLMAEGFDGMVTFDASRIARRSLVQETLLSLIWNAGLRVFTTTAGELSADESDPTKILIRQVIAAVAEFEHRSLVVKLHAARRAKSAAGGFAGGTPKYGTTVIGTGSAAQFVEDAVESSVIKRINELRFAYGMSYRAIADTLNANNIVTKRGKKWLPTQVQRIIQRTTEMSQTQGQ